MQLAREGAAEGLWLRAESQTRGRGRLGRAWVSPPGNLYASTLVRLRAGDPSAPSLALVAAVALEEVVAAYAPEDALMLKWPNDLLSGGAKLAGILLEREGDAVVVGFGVNLAYHPNDLDRPVTSLRGRAPAPGIFMYDLAEAFARWLSCWRAEGLAPVRARWLARAHKTGTPLSVRDATGVMIEGLFDGLDDTGALRLRFTDGMLQIIQAGDVFLM